MLIRSIPLSKKASLSYKPDFIAKDIVDIDFEYLRSLGVTTCFIDLDGTVVDRGSFQVDPKVTAALKKSGLDIKIATNRPRSRSLQKIEAGVNASGVIHPVGLYGKPTKHYFRYALKDHNLKEHQVVLIGDRFLQDIIGANRSGIYSLLVYKLGRSIGRIDALISKTEQHYAHKFAEDYLKVPK